MKKNKMMRLASGLLVAVLITTSTISGTFAKYVTKGEATDSARVAKWGVTVTANGSTFADAYATDDGAFTDVNSVISADDFRADIANGVYGRDNVLAPGTSGDMVSVQLAGTPEVAVRVTCEEATLELGTNWIYNNGSSDEYYCPLVFTIRVMHNGVENTEVFYGMDYTNADDFETAVENYIKTYSRDYIANTNLATLDDNALDVHWEWSFENKGEAHKNDKNTDIKDTYLGDRTAADINLAPTVSLTVRTAVTQID